MTNSERTAGAELRQSQGLLGSMRVRIVLTVVILLAVSAGVSIALLRGVLRDRLDEEITVALDREAEEFEILAQGLNPRTGEPFAGDFAAVFSLYFEREVPDEGETLIAFVDGEQVETENSPSAVPASQLGDAVTYWLTLTSRDEGTLDTDAGKARYVALPRSEGGRTALFVAANFPETEQTEIDQAVRAQAIVQFVMILLASLVGLTLAGRVLRPLRRLADTARTISATDLTQRIPVRGDDEASRIATTFNEMLERIERSFETQRQFLDDTSHELRSPMTVIRGHVELLELEDDAGERDTMLKIIRDEIDRMNRIVEDLLLLARSERPDFLSYEPIVIAELLQDIHRRASVLCPRDWILDDPPGGVLMADRQRLTQALVQYAQNVCEHTPEGSSARIGARVENGWTCLWVDDVGPGIPAEQSANVFARFVKAPYRPEGSGLGLSIVAAIVEAHGGRARLGAKSGPGARFEIWLPLTPNAVTEERASDPYRGSGVHS